MSEKQSPSDVTSTHFGEPIYLENRHLKNPDFDVSKGDDPITNPKMIPTMGGHAMISQFLNVKKNYHTRLKDMVASDDHACRYFCTDDCAYVFSLDILKSLVHAIEKGIKEANDKEKGSSKNGCLVLFQGLRKHSKNDPQQKGKQGFGRPTVIATAYVQGKDNILTYVPITKLYRNGVELEGTPEYEAFEHPGDGNSGIQYSSDTEKTDITSAVVQPTSNEFYDTDYIIRKTIKPDSKGRIGSWIR